MAKLDDFLSKKKESVTILDLSKAVANSKDEFRRLYDKVPEFKIKPEKVRVEDLKVREKKFKFKTGRKDLKAAKEKYTFLDPLPQEMNNLTIDDLAKVTIDWKMLTTQRPKTKVEEDFFSRLVEIGKLQMKTVASDKRTFALDTQIRRIKNKAGILERRVVSCTECGEEFCNGKMCGLLTYDCFTRVPEAAIKALEKTQSVAFEKKGKKKKRKIKVKVPLVTAKKGKEKKSGKKTKPKSPRKSATK